MALRTVAGIGFALLLIDTGAAAASHRERFEGSARFNYYSTYGQRSAHLRVARRHVGMRHSRPQIAKLSPEVKIIAGLTQQLHDLRKEVTAVEELRQELKAFKDQISGGPRLPAWSGIPLEYDPSLSPAHSLAGLDSASRFPDLRDAGRRPALPIPINPSTASLPTAIREELAGIAARQVGVRGGQDLPDQDRHAGLYDGAARRCCRHRPPSPGLCCEARRRDKAGAGSRDGQCRGLFRLSSAGVPHRRLQEQVQLPAQLRVGRRHVRHRPAGLGVCAPVVQYRRCRWSLSPLRTTQPPGIQSHPVRRHQSGAERPAGDHYGTRSQGPGEDVARFGQARLCGRSAFGVDRARERPRRRTSRSGRRSSRGDPGRLVRAARQVSAATQLEVGSPQHLWECRRDPERSVQAGESTPLGQ